MPKTVGVAVSNATFHFDKLYTYAVMPDQQEAVRLGSMVLVPFGRGSKARMGVVLACDEEPEHAKLKYLFDVAPASACLTPELLRLVHFLKERTFCTYYEAVKAVIPYGAQYKPALAADGVTPVLQKQLTRHTENSYKLVGALQQKPKPTAKQLAAVALLSGGERTQNEMEAHGITKAVLDNLCAKGVVECSKVNKSIDLYSSIPLKNEPITLTAEQQAAYDALLPGLEDAAPHSALLYGVTGSGKTLVFLKLIERCLALGRRALVLVPEISLTPQMILRLKSQFGRRVAVQHSALNHTERLLQWQMIQDGGADIVVGTRSAVFAPLENIGLVIIDEEQEHTYRSESAPRYAAHEVARQRAAENGSLLLLASATPSTESFYAARNGRTQLVRLTQRYGGNPLPSVQIVDMRAELASGNPREISLAMEDAIRRNLDAGKQTILLLNRRGYQTMAQCDDCREVLKCPKCSVPMVYHKAGHKLLCHYCGTQLDPPPKTCPACGGKLLYRGFGTQKAEEELAELFPEARVLRMDQDSTAAKDAHEKLLAKFARHEYDIMVGTQMVAKGLDFRGRDPRGRAGHRLAALCAGVSGPTRRCSASSPRWWAAPAGPRTRASPSSRPPTPTTPSSTSPPRRTTTPFSSRRSPTASWASTRPSAGSASWASPARRRSRWPGPPPASAALLGPSGRAAAGPAPPGAWPHPRQHRKDQRELPLQAHHQVPRRQTLPRPCPPDPRPLRAGKAAR